MGDFITKPHLKVIKSTLSFKDVTHKDLADVIKDIEFAGGKVLNFEASNFKQNIWFFKIEHDELFFSKFLTTTSAKIYHN
jgi:hypothetical protein